MKEWRSGKSARKMHASTRGSYNPLALHSPFLLYTYVSSKYKGLRPPQGGGI